MTSGTSTWSRRHLCGVGVHLGKGRVLAAAFLDLFLGDTGCVPLDFLSFHLKSKAGWGVFEGTEFIKIEALHAAVHCSGWWFDRRIQSHDQQLENICTSPFPIMPINSIIGDKMMGGKTPDKSHCDCNNVSFYINKFTFCQLKLILGVGPIFEHRQIKAHRLLCVNSRYMIFIPNAQLVEYSWLKDTFFLKVLIYITQSTIYFILQTSFNPNKCGYICN